MASAGSSSRSVPTVPIVDVGCCPSKSRVRGINKELQDLQKSMYDKNLMDAQLESTQKDELQKQRDLDRREYEKDKAHLKATEEILKQEVQRLHEEIAEMKKGMKENNEKIEIFLREQLQAELGKDGFEKAGEVVGRVMKSVSGSLPWPFGK
ncbi:uncharacterized protein [Littorina saxatilis]|uniref:Uncharacterized protein n=1 Tax=Littorina saxatilis TaxID=31220 RepID=A0AAN9B483_9CAEN